MYVVNDKIIHKAMCKSRSYYSPSNLCLYLHCFTWMHLKRILKFITFIFLNVIKGMFILVDFITTFYFHDEIILLAEIHKLRYDEFF